MLKLISKDRNFKTTRNIQEGLPFTIENVRRQTEDPKLTERVQEIADKYNGTGRLCKDVQDYNTLMRYLISVVIFGHFQRPSVAQSMTVDEFVRGKADSDGRVVILVSDHKTSAQGPAQFALEPEAHKLFSLYAKRSLNYLLLIISNSVFLMMFATSYNFSKLMVRYFYFVLNKLSLSRA